MEQGKRPAISVEVITNTFVRNTNSWNQPFNQASFMNLDPNNSVWINSIEVPKQQQLVIPLNVGEVNNTNYSFDFRGSTTANLTIIFTRYSDIKPNQWAGSAAE